MTRTDRLRRAALIALLPVALGACGGRVDPSPVTGSDVPAATASLIASTPVPTEPAPTAVPGGETEEPVDVPTDRTTSQTDWGEILDAVPSTFPRFPGAGPVDSPDGPASLAVTAPVATDAAAAWYRDALTAQGYGVELSGALEDGSRVLDATTDLPECRIRIDFHPMSGSTMIVVLYGAGCGGLGG
jgi:hypothetical protein